MNADECWGLLKRKSVGRLAVAVKGRPDIFPVSYAVDGESIVIRTNPGLKLAASTLGLSVAFEVDDLDEDRHLGASVVIQGTAQEIEVLEALLEVERLLVEPWDEGGKTRHLRVNPETVVDGVDIVDVKELRLVGAWAGWRDTSCPVMRWMANSRPRRDGSTSCWRFWNTTSGSLCRVERVAVCTMAG